VTRARRSFLERFALRRSGRSQAVEHRVERRVSATREAEFCGGVPHRAERVAPLEPKEPMRGDVLAPLVRRVLNNDDRTFVVRPSQAPRRDLLEPHGVVEPLARSIRGG
jgi:hypothetical protein